VAIQIKAPRISWVLDAGTDLPATQAMAGTRLPSLTHRPLSLPRKRGG